MRAIIATSLLIAMTALTVIGDEAGQRAAKPATRPATQPTALGDVRAEGESLIAAQRLMLKLYTQEYAAGMRAYTSDFYKAQRRIAEIEIELNPQLEIQIRTRLLEDAQAMLKHVDTRVQAGMVSRSDKAAAECAVAEARYALAKAQTRNAKEKK